MVPETGTGGAERGGRVKVSKRDLERAVGEGVISGDQAERLWRSFEAVSPVRQRFDLPHVAYYFGAMVVISAMGWFMTLGWARFGDGGVFAISLVYALVFLVAGRVLWGAQGLWVPGGLLVTLAVCMTPLAVFSFEQMTGLWVQGVPGDYGGYYDWIKGSWFFMEVATIAAGLTALYFFRFPFLTAPIAFSLWFMSMDLTPLIYGESYQGTQGLQTVSLVFGLAMLTGAFLVDRRTRDDYAFWGYLFGMFAFWGGLSTLIGESELEWFVYGAINLGLMLISVLLDRRVFLVFGSLGVFGYVGHLAEEIFEDSIFFPFVLSGIGLGIIALGILYARNRNRLEHRAQALIPEPLRRFLPTGRPMR